MNMRRKTLIGFIFHNLNKTKEITQEPQAHDSAPKPDLKMMNRLQHFHQRNLHWEEVKEKKQCKEESEKK